MPRILLLPGFGGRADQSILVQLEGALVARGLQALRASLKPGRPSPGLEREVAEAERLAGASTGVFAYAGRSFGGRVLARLALRTSPRALILLGFPIRSATGRRRPEDQAVLESLRCPTLVVQGARDPLGPVRTFQRLAARNRCLELRVVPGARHGFGRSQAAAVSAAAEWLAAQLQPG